MRTDRRSEGRRPQVSAKRYSIQGSSAALVEEDNGVLVKWEDYAALQAEVERLAADVNQLADGLKLASEVGIKIADKITRLKAENERLRKAGDQFFESEIGYFGEHILDNPKHPSYEMLHNWLAAKGVQP
jgi:hypothetical protein